ncbi:Poly(A)-specific ribonuclease PNLDC1 [Varanus komodoensis]|nr:Poly(A)-specific ribonuclease PNLDC1 [Varanus komodoensis]
MDVGAAQFEEKLPRLQELLLGCDFVGLDMEFTGLHSVFSPEGEPSLFDSPSEWYRKARWSVQQFTVSQLGLSIFCNERSNKYVAHSYNFFLFPMTFGQKDSEFSFQATSVQFLSHYGFDYNKFLKDGIPYMNKTQEEKFQHLLPGSWMIRSGFGKDKLKQVIDEVTRWISLAEEEDSMVLQDLYGFQLFEIQLILRQAIQDIWTVPLGGQEVMVIKLNPQQRWLLQNTSYDSCRREQILLSARGFTNLFQTLVEARKPLVGHNMLMDLLHLHEKFYKSLPESYEMFKKNIHTLFPVLLDTKNITKAFWKEFQFPQASTLLEIDEVLCSSLSGTAQSCPEIFHASDCLRYGAHESPSGNQQAVYSLPQFRNLIVLKSGKNLGCQVLLSDPELASEQLLVGQEEKENCFLACCIIFHPQSPFLLCNPPPLSPLPSFSLFRLFLSTLSFPPFLSSLVPSHALFLSSPAPTLILQTLIHEDELHRSLHMKQPMMHFFVDQRVGREEYIFLVRLPIKEKQVAAKEKGASQWHHGFGIPSSVRLTWHLHYDLFGARTSVVVSDGALPAADQTIAENQIFSSLQHDACASDLSWEPPLPFSQSLLQSCCLIMTNYRLDDGIVSSSSS